MTLVVTADSFAMSGISVNPSSSPGAVASFLWYPADSVSFLRKLNRTANLAHVCALETFFGACGPTWPSAGAIFYSSAARNTAAFSHS